MRAARFHGRFRSGLWAVLLGLGVCSQTAEGKQPPCQYGPSGPSLEHARQSFQVLDYACSAQELHAFLTRETLSRGERADAHILLGTVLFAQIEQPAARDEQTLEQFINAFRAFPDWRGEPYFTTPDYRALMDEARALVAAENATLLASTANTPVAAPNVQVSPARAGAPGASSFRAWEIAIGLGPTIPAGDFGDLADPGLMFGVYAGYYLSPRFAVGFEVHPHAFEASSEVIRSTRQLTGDPGANARWSQTQAGVFGKFLLTGGRTSPFVRFHVGSYRRQAIVEAFNIEATSSQTDFGFAGGGGVQFKRDGILGGFAEATLNTVPDENTSVIFLDLRAGLLLSLGR